MTGHEVRSPGQGGWAREKTGVLAVAVLTIGGLVFYLALRASGGPRDGQKNLLPYQVLVPTLPEPDQQMYRAIRQGLVAAETDRARLSQWPAASVLTEHDVAAFSDSRFTWQEFQKGAIINYFATPVDPATPAWLLVFQEPEPNTPPDPAPLDDEHHRLPDGTTLHIYVWTHRYGGRVKAGYVPQPQADGWTEVFNQPPNPVVPMKK